MEGGRVRLSCDSPSQILAKSLSAFVNDHSLSQSVLNTSKSESEIISHDYEQSNNDKKGSDGENVDQGKVLYNNGEFDEDLKVNGERLPWNGSLQTLKEFMQELLHEHGKWTSPGGEAKRFKIQMVDMR